MRITLRPAAEPIFDGELPQHELHAVLALLHYCGRIDAIKFLRSAYKGTSLLSAKDAVNELQSHYNVPSTYSRSVHDGAPGTSLGDILLDALKK